MTRSPALPDGIPLKVDVRDRRRGGRDRGRPARQPRLPCRRAQPLAGLRDGQRDDRASSTRSTGDVPHNAGSFRRVDVLLREGCIAGIPTFPHSCSMATTNVADRLVDHGQAAFAELGDGFGLAEGGMGLGAGFAVVSGNDPSGWQTGPYVNQMFLGSATAAPARPSRRLADLRDPRLRPGCIYNDSIEVTSRSTRSTSREQRLLPTAAAPGRHRGAPGARPCTARTKRPMSVSYSLEAHEPAAWACAEGVARGATEVWMLNAAGERVEVPPSRAGTGSRASDRLGLGRRRRLRRPAHADPEAVLPTCARAGSAGRRAGGYGVVLSESR